METVIGVVAPGYLADLIVVKTNPLEDIMALEAVYLSVSLP